METANEGEGDNLTRCSTPSEQIADGPPARDSENNDSPFKEDTLQQMLTCETGNTGTKASTPPCDKGTTGQGLPGTSTANNNLDKGQYAISVTQLEAPEVAETTGLEGPMDLEGSSSDESGDWETASEASVAYEEITNVEKQDESLDGNEKMDLCSPKETGDYLELQTSCGHLETPGSDRTGELAEQQICERTCSKAPGEQDFTHDEESLFDDYGRLEMPPEAEEAVREGTVSAGPDSNVTDETGSDLVNTVSPIEKLTDEASDTGGSQTHVEKSELQDEKAVNEWTRPHEEKNSHSEEGAIHGIETPSEETANTNMDPQKSIPASEWDEAQPREASDPHVPHAEETMLEFRESLVKVTESESIDPDGNKLVRIETQPCVIKILIEPCGPTMEEAVNVGTGHYDEGTVSDHAKSPGDGTGHHDEGTVSDHAKSPGDGTGYHDEGTASDHAKSPGDGTGYHDEGTASDQAKSHGEGVVSAVTGHHHDEGTVSDQAKTQPEGTVNDGTGHHHDEEMASHLAKSHGDGTGHHEEGTVSDQATPQAEGAVNDGTGHHHDEVMASHLAKSHGDGAVSDGIGHHYDEEVVSDLAESLPKEHDDDEAICFTETNECYIKEPLSEESEPYANEDDRERTITYDEAYVDDEKGPCICEILAEGTRFDTDIEETNSDQTLSAELEGNNISKVTEESSDSGYVTCKEQGPLDMSTSKEAVDSKMEKVNNEEVVYCQPAINKNFSVDQKETTKDKLENDITERVSEETASQVKAQDLNEDISRLLDVEIEDIVNKESESASTETVSHVLSRAIEETVDTEAECAYIKTVNEHTEEWHKEALIQVTLDTTRGTVIEETFGDTTKGTVIEETLGDFAKSDCKERDDGSIELFNEETSYQEPVREGVHTDSRDTPEYETAADAAQTIEILMVINAPQTIESVDETSAVDHKEMLGTVKETSDSDSIERPNENVTRSFVEMTEQDNTFVERIVIEPSSEERELEKQRTIQENEELSNLKEHFGEISEIHPHIQTLNYESESYEDEISWYVEDTELQALKEDLETTWLESESSDMNFSELEANLTSPEHLKEESHQRLLDLDVDQAVSITDETLYMEVASDKGTKTDTSEQVSLDEAKIKEMVGGESNKYPSLLVMESCSSFGMVVEPLTMRPLVFSKDSLQNLNAVEEPNLQNFQMGEGVESLGDSHHKDFTDFEYREQGSPLGETLSNRSQIETIEEDQEQIQGVIKVARIVGINFSGQKELSEDQPDCFNQGLIFDQGLEENAFLPKTKPFTESETDDIFGQEETLTAAAEPDISDITLSQGGPVGDDQGKLDSSIKRVEDEDGPKVDSQQIQITRRRSNTDPCLICDQEEKDNTQQDDQREKGKPRPRLRSVTPPLDNFTVSFTATTPQAIPESKPPEKVQTSLMPPDVDYNVNEEQKTEEAAPKQDFTFFPTQIFNPLFFIREGREEHGFYQDRPLLPPEKENLNKRRIPSPPRETDVPLTVQQPQTIGITNRTPAPTRTTMDTSASGSSAAQQVNPRWLPPRPLRHAESAVGKDFRPLKPTEPHLIRRPTVRVKKNTVAGPPGKRVSAMNLPTIPQEVPSGEKSSMEKSPRPAGTKVSMSNTTKPLTRQSKFHEQDVAQPKTKSPMERLAEAVESSRKPPRSPEAVLRRTEKQSPNRKTEPPKFGTLTTIPRRYSNFIHSYSLLYQEYSDVALNQEIQRQKPGGSPAEEKDPGSPRQRRRILSSQDSYLQRLSISSADSLWQDLPKIRDSVTFMSMSREEQKLQEAKFELIMSEALYLRSLNIAVDHFQRSTELQDVLSAQDRQWLFSRLSEVRDASNDFLFDLEEEFEKNMYKFQVCDVVISHEPNFRKVYLPYVTNQTYQDRTFQRLMNGNPRFQQVLSKLESDPVCQRLSLKSFLILPFQRITRLRLLLQNILKRSSPGSNEELQATEAHNVIEKLIRDCNEGVQKMKDTEELILLHQKIQFECKIFPLISASRRLVKHGEVTSLEFNPISFKWKGTTRQVYVHLFNDCLLLSRIREGGRFVVFDHASDFRVERCEIKLHSNQKNIFRVFLRDSAATQARDGHLEGQEMEYIFRTETQSQKLRWIHALSPPKQEIDFLSLEQVQCLKSYKARENDEMSLEKADILMVTQNSYDGWLCGIRLSDLQSGWFPQCHAQTIGRNACLRNLEEEQRLRTARAKLQPTGAK